MSNNDIYFKVAKVISDQLNIEENEITNESSFNKLGADDLDQIEIIMQVEEMFNIEITDEQVDKIVYIKDLINCIENNTN